LEEEFNKVNEKFNYLIVTTDEMIPLNVIFKWEKQSNYLKPVIRRRGMPLIKEPSSETL